MIARRDALMAAVDALIAGGSSAAVAPRPNPRPAHGRRRRRRVERGRAGRQAARGPAAPARRRARSRSTPASWTPWSTWSASSSSRSAILAEDPALPASADERLSRSLAQLKRITSDLQRNAMSMRMVPIRQMFQKMARLVRDLSKQSGKHIELVLAGEDTELDRKVVEDINDPLMHMVRNSVDHGIESPRAARRGRQAGAGDAAPAAPRTRAATSSSRSPTTAPAWTPSGSWRKAVANGLVARGRAAGAGRRPPADLPARLLDRRAGHRDLRARRRHGRRAPQHRRAARPHRHPHRRAARAPPSRSGCR